MRKTNIPIEFRRYVRSAVVAYLILVAAVGYALTTKVDVNALRDGLTSSCHRTNIIRAQSNVSDFVSFRILSLSSQRERSLVKGDPKNAKVHEQSANLLADSAMELTIIDLTNCRLAVSHAKSYRYPTAAPMGNARTGKMGPGADKILDKSRKLLQTSTSAPKR